MLYLLSFRVQNYTLCAHTASFLPSFSHKLQFSWPASNDETNGGFGSYEQVWISDGSPFTRCSVKGWGQFFYIPSKLIGRIPLYLHWRRSTKILQKWRKGQLFLVMIGLKGLFLSDFWRFLFIWRKVKIFLNFGALRIAQKSPNARWQANMRVLSHYPQIADNETFGWMLPLPDFLL